MDSFGYILANHIASHTQDLPGRYHYSDEEWMTCIKFLFEQGHDQKYVLWMLQSKHMEWAALGKFPGKRADGFMEYYYRHAVRIEVMRRAELAEAT